MDFYEFAESRGEWQGSPPIVCIGPKRFVSDYMNEKDFRAIFEGYVVYRDDDTGADYIGVWGARNAAKFRRLLRTRGAKFKLNRGFLPSLTQRMRSIGAADDNESGTRDPGK